VNDFVIDLSPWIYYGSTTALLVVCVIAAITIKDPNLVFDGMSGLFVTSLIYIFPSLMYLQAYNTSTQFEPRTTMKILACC
jgi:hypothetical protein